MLSGGRDRAYFPNMLPRPVSGSLTCEKIKKGGNRVRTDSWRYLVYQLKTA